MHDLGPATQELVGLVARVDDTDLDRSTPCADWTVRGLLVHLLGLTAHFATVARHEPGAAPPGELPADWRGQLVTRALDLAVAWRDPAAWSGESEAGGVRMSWAELGVVALEEVVMHGWDLAVAFGAPFAVADDDAAAVEGFVVGALDLPPEQRGGLYGPALAVPGEASRFERLLALAGREPHALAG